MPRKNSHITVTDQFCGAGGSSQGVRRLSNRHGGGLEVKIALNHWKLAIETHNTNFPDTLHDCTDISACDPRRYPSTDILITSPECTTHSPAGGNNHKSLKKQMELFDTCAIDPATERSRATMWDVCRFAEYHQYNAINVEDMIEDMYLYYSEQENPEPVVCSVFGCGRILTIREKLFGNKCINHSKSDNDQLLK